MNSRLRKLLLPLLRATAKGLTPTFRMRSAASQALFLVGKPKQKPSQGRLRRVSKRSTKNEETAKIREAVMGRAHFCCEACGLIWRIPQLQMDHWLSGSGRRTAKQSVETCWALCPPCHHNRTHNLPTAEHWNAKFAAHAMRYGYPAISHVVHQPVGGAVG